MSESEKSAIGVIGVGWVGLVTAGCFAELGHPVWAVDIDERKVAMLNAGGSLPIYEPGLPELVEANRERLHFTTEIGEVLEQARLLFCCVDTPPTYSGDADLSRVQSVVSQLPAGSEHALRHVNAGLGHAITEQRLPGHRQEGDVQVHAIQQWTRQPAQVAAAGQGRADAGLVTARRRARAGVGGKHQLKGGRIPGLPAGAMKRHLTALQRLTQSVEYPARELWRLVQEQHPPMRPGDGARSCYATAAAHDRCGRRGVMRAFVRRPAHEGRVRRQHSGHRVDGGYLKRLVVVQPGQDSAQPLGQHRLAGTGRALQVQMVTTGRGHFQRSPSLRLTDDVAQVGTRERRPLLRHGADEDAALFAAKVSDQISQ